MKIKKTVVKTLNVKLTLNDAEMTFLLRVMERVAGETQKSDRKFAATFINTLKPDGFNKSDIINSRDCPISGSIYCMTWDNRYNDYVRNISEN